MARTGPIRRTALAAGMAVALVVALAACGGGDDGNADELQELLDELGIDDDLGAFDLGDENLGDVDLGELEDLDLGDLDVGDLFDGTELEELIEEGADSNVDVEFVEDGFSVESEDGSFSIDDDGTFTVTDDEGRQTTGEVDLDGSGGGDLSIEGEDGDVEFSTGSDLPDGWPSDIPEPDGVEITSSTAIDENGEPSIVITGTAGDDPASWAGDYGAQLEDAGFSEESRFEAADDVTLFYTDGARNVAVIATLQAGATSVSITISAAE